MINLPAIRARHARAQERLDANDTGWPLTLTLAAAHADRGVLLAELTANERVLFEAGVRLGRCARKRDDLQAALDRLAALTPDEMAQVIADAYPLPDDAVEMAHGDDAR